jgi:hypothetical protein
LYFWEHYPSNKTHILRDYLGGYAVRTIDIGIAAVTPPVTTDGFYVAGGAGTKIPGRYVPVAQGFFVFSNSGGGQVIFKNSQRVFERETNDSNNDGSTFIKSVGTKSSKTGTNQTAEEENSVQIIRLEFETPDGAIRPLALGFNPDNKATDGVDYGYDAKVYETLPNDMSLMINNERYVIETVGAFDDTKKYPIGIFLTKTGSIKISVSALENMDPNTKVYIFDALLGNYTKINDKNQSFEMTLDIGDYLNRFYITFKKDNLLSLTEDEQLNMTSLSYLQSSKEIYIKTNNNVEVKQVYLTNILGQTIKSWNVTNTPYFSHDMKLPVGNVSEGTYIVKVETSHGNINKKIIIQN